MSLFRLFSMVAFAAEMIISPIPSDEPAKPQVSFAMISAPIPVVLSASTDLQPTPTALPTSATGGPTPTPTVIQTPTPTPVPTNKNIHGPITIAILGDSMVDTLGPGVPQLTHELTKHFPYLSPMILNYGVGATNIDYGIERITHDYQYLGRPIPSLASQHPDIVIIESFGYNPYSFDTGALDKHWMALAKAVDTIKTTLPRAKIMIAATIAPNAKVFGDGAPNLAFSADEKWKRVDTIKSYLESTTRFAQGQNLPLIDAYHPSLMADGNGRLEYINGGDHIHTSDAGRAFFAEKVVEAMIANNILE